MDAIIQDEMQEILHDFLVESTELIEGMDKHLVDLEKSSGDPEILNTIFRSMHTIKGAAGFLSLQAIVDVAHAAENVLNKLRQGKLVLTPGVVDVLLRSVDMLRMLLFHVSERTNREEDVSPLMALLRDAEEGRLASAEAIALPKACDVSQAVPAMPFLEKEAVAQPGPRVEATPLAPVETKAVKEESETIRVDIKRLDNVMNMVGELVLGRNRLSRLCVQLEDRYGDGEHMEGLKATAAHLNLITADLQLAVMKARMQPVQKVFGRFPRLVRDLSRDIGKEVSLTLVGEDTEIDKTIIEEIGDPLVHLVRNSIDHGIEPPADRVRAGKPPAGRLTLSALHKGSNIHITVEDDGRGIDVEKVKSKAAEKGIASPADLERMSEKEALGLIFLPGFSTAARVTGVSGRGVGMDVVKTNITRLGGNIDIETSLGKGTKMVLRLPLTLAIIHALLVRTGVEDYALPLQSVVEILKANESDLRTVDSKEVVYSRDRVYPLVRLSDAVGSPGGRGGSGYAVLISYGEKTFALLVDELLGQEEVVIKSMGEYLGSTKGVSGATITGDGRVVLILDIVGLCTEAASVCARPAGQ